MILNDFQAFPLSEKIDNNDRDKEVVILEMLEKIQEYRQGENL
ncbi:hypothetical protein ACYSNU_01815 [Enterococcus sp. LJL120]